LGQIIPSKTSSVFQSLSDDDLERYHLGLVTDEEELAVH
jgi:hypothetical protein